MASHLLTRLIKLTCRDIFSFPNSNTNSREPKEKRKVDCSSKIIVVLCDMCEDL